MELGQLVGSKLIRTSLSEPVHTCTVCDFPISTYGRLVRRRMMSPNVQVDCNHVFCLTCAKASPTCATYDVVFFW
jgi:hypothetical protein